jgi:hypothetical protein
VTDFTDWVRETLDPAALALERRLERELDALDALEDRDEAMLEIDEESGGRGVVELVVDAGVVVVELDESVVVVVIEDDEEEVEVLEAVVEVGGVVEDVSVA